MSFLPSFSPTRPTYTYTFSSSTNNPDLKSLAMSAGWDGSNAFANIAFVVNSSVEIGSTSTGTAAFLVRTSDFPAGINIELTINSSAYISGKGGLGGGNGGSGEAGGNGGDAIDTDRAISIDNSGTVQGGGGGGGAGGSTPYGGGGGGDGRQVGGGGDGSTGSPPLNGAGGNLTTGGAGGDDVTSTQGGNGGNAGQNGNNGESGGSGGTAGNYAVGNSNITWVATGTRLGNVSA